MTRNVIIRDRPGVLPIVGVALMQILLSIAALEATGLITKAKKYNTDGALAADLFVSLLIIISIYL